MLILVCSVSGLYCVWCYQVVACRFLLEMRCVFAFRIILVSIVFAVCKNVFVVIIDNYCKYVSRSLLLSLFSISLSILSDRHPSSALPVIAISFSISVIHSTVHPFSLFYRRIHWITTTYKLFGMQLHHQW